LALSFLRQPLQNRIQVDDSGIAGLHVTFVSSVFDAAHCRSSGLDGGMVSTPRKRHASRSPENNRLAKRPLTSESPEEGELDDPPPPTIQPISLPPKPQRPQPVAKVPFPFKKKIENPFVGEKVDVKSVVSQKLDGESPRKVREESRRYRNPCLRRTQKQEVQAYGHKFIGCGLQSDYDVTTKLGEGTFGFVVHISFESYLKSYPLSLQRGAQGYSEVYRKGRSSEADPYAQ
jgi:hypothetical protein